MLVPCLTVLASQFQLSETRLSDDIVYDVNADGTYTLDETIQYRVNRDQGAKESSQLPLGYSVSLQRLDVLEAHTQQPRMKGAGRLRRKASGTTESGQRERAHVR